jgi:hypothetical protein
LGNDFNKPLIPQVTEEVTQRPSGNVFKDPITGGGQPFYGPGGVTLRPGKPPEGGIGTAEEEYAKIQEGKNRPSKDVRYGENMSFEEFKAEYDAGKTPMQQGPSERLPILSAGGIGGLPEIDMPIAGGNKNAGGILPVMPQLPGFRDDTSTKMPGGPPPTQPNMSDEDIMKGFAEFKKQNPDLLNRPGTMAIVNLTLPGGTPMRFNSGAGAAVLRQYLQSIGMEAGPGQGMGEPFKKAVQPGGSLKALSSGGIARMLGE